MKKYRLKEKVSCVNTNFGICQDHKQELKESDFPKGRADELVKKGFLIEVGAKAKPKAKKEEK